MAGYQTQPSPAPGTWNAPSYSTPYQNAASIFSPVGTVQHTNMIPNTQHTNIFPNTLQSTVFVNTQQAQIYPNTLSPTITTHVLQPTTDNIFSVFQASADKSKVELEFEQQLADAKKLNRFLPDYCHLHTSF
jgi:hypothetical protein